MSSFEPRTLRELQQALREGTLTVRRLMERVLHLRARHAAAAWISVRPESDLLAEAEACDARLRAEGAALWDRQPLFGLPFAVKDNIDVAGLPTTAACPGFATGPAARHATVVQRLLEAGAIAVGKTNLDQFATGLVGTRSPYGAVPNPFDAAYVSGGSSSGSAYVVATGQVPFALGTDTAGSGRVPAGFCHVSGLKPTKGWLPATGVLPACRSLDCVSVFALTPEDAWAVASRAAGSDPQDAFSRSALAPRLRTDTLQGLAVGVPEPLEFFGDTQAQAAFEAALQQLRTQGCRLVPVPFEPLQRAAALLYQGPWVAERYAAVGSFLDGQPPGADPTVSEIVRRGRAPAAHELFAAQYALAEVQRYADALWSEVAVLAVPSAPNHPTQAALQADPFEPNQRLGHYTNFVNLLDMAAHAVPGPMRADGLPAGVTLIGPAFSDFALATLATRLARLFEPTAGAMRHPIGAAPELVAPAPAQPLRLVVVGAHLGGLALNWQLTERTGRLLRRTRTAAAYRLYSLTGHAPTRPALVHVGAADGRAIDVEVWEFDAAHLGSFLQLVGAPLALGTVELSDGTQERGFVCEPRGVASGGSALDITAYGGWRGFLASLG